MKLKLLVLLLFMISSFLWAQSQGTISGFAYDEDSGEALIGANIFIDGTNIGSSTNTMGFYSIPKIPAGTFNLVCQYIGYKVGEQSVSLKPNGKQEIVFRLKPTTLYTESVSVVADSERTSVQLFRKPISEMSISPREIQNIPQVMETDLLRSLQTMPGIASVSDYSSELYVRGGTPDQNLYLIDGTDVYNPEHLFGLFSTFNTDAIKNAEISKGGFGVEYGGRLSSVLDVTNLDGNRREYTGKISVSILSAKTTMQMPIGKIGAISGSIRRTYFDKTLGQMDSFSDIPDYYFYDGHLKAYFDLGKHDKLTISTYKGKDDLNFTFDEDNPNSESMIYYWGNTTASVRWTHIFSSQLFGNFWLTSSSFASKFKMGEDFFEENDIDDRTVKGNMEYFFSQDLSFKLGFEYKDFDILYKSDFPGGEVNVGQKPVHFASYLKAEWKPMPLMDVQAGLRLNTSDNAGVSRHDYDPRFSLKYRLTDTWNVKAATGRYHQYLFKIPRFFIADIWSASDKYYDDAKSNHYILGLQKEVANDYQFEVETYYKDYVNLFVFDNFFWVDKRVSSYNDNGEPFYTDTEDMFDIGTGKAYGLEMMLRKDTGPVTGWVAYTLGRVENTVQNINQGNSFVPRHDRTHTFNMVGTVDLNNAIRALKGLSMSEQHSKWRLGFGFIYASGQPITTTSSVYVTNVLPDQTDYTGYNLYPTERNNFRLPAYIRMDLSLTYSEKHSWGTFEPFLQIYNVTNRKNVWFINYNDEFDGNKITQEVDTTTMLPIFPSIGFNILF